MEEFLKLVGVLLTTTCGLDPRRLYRDNFASLLNYGDSFDFIVVGSGPSGAAIASRLAENPKWKVLLVEAGGYPNAASEIPSTSIGQVGTELDWQYRMEPMKTAALGINEQKPYIARGKMLGGTSSLNLMVYTRGLESDYNNWEKLGNPGWGWKDVEPYFKKLEKLENSNNDHYGKSGRLLLNLEEPTEFQKIIMGAGRSLGKHVANFEESKSGFFILPTTILAGKRVSSAKAYLNKSKNKQPNLYLSLDTLVTKLIIRKQTVTGVELLRSGEVIQIRATREVILSAGAIGSPQILMLSGVGPESHLRKLKIPVRKDLQVGENLQDHPVNLGFCTKINPLPAPEKSVDAMNYCLYKNGTFARNNNFNLIWSLNSIPNKDEPSAHLHFTHVHKGDKISRTSFLTLFQVNNTVIKSLEGVLDSHDSLCVEVLITNPKSRGRILLKSTHPLDHPVIHGGFFTDEKNEDLTAMVNAIDHIKKLLEAPTMKSLKPEIVYLDLPGCKGFNVSSRDYWNCHARYMSTSGFHLAGSCKMGPAEDKAAVVDSSLRVYGIKGLRVADASIMPVITNRNPQGPVYMIGEKAADLIKKDHGFSN